MARFEVFANPAGPGYLLDVQADVLDGLTTCVVVPLLPLAQAPRPAGHLNPGVRYRRGGLHDGNAAPLGRAARDA